MEKDERIDVDHIITAISVARSHAETMLFYLFPYFDKADPDADTMLEIRWEYEHIRTLLEVVQDCMTIIEQQENVWTEMWTGQKRKAQAAE